MRRWIAIARGMSISCSVIAHISVSHGSGLRRTRSHGCARTARPITGSSRKRAWKLGEVVVDPGREAHARDARRAPPPPSPRARRTRCPATATTTGSPSTCSSRTSPLPRRRVSPSSEARPEPERRPARRDDLAHEDERARRTPCRGRRPRAGATRRGAAGGRRPGTSSTTTISPIGPELLALLRAPSWCGGARRRRPSPRRRRSRWRPARPPGPRSTTAAGRAPRARRLSVTTGRPSTTSTSWTSSASSAPTKHRPYRPRRTCMVPNTRSQYGALIPKPRSSSWKWWRMCSSRSHFPIRVRGVWWCRCVVDHVVGEIAGQEAGAEGERAVGAEHEPERRVEDQRQRHRGGGRHDEPQRVVRVVVVDAVDHPVQPRADPVLGLEVEDHAVDPVLGERPQQVAAERVAERRPRSPRGRSP